MEHVLVDLHKAEGAVQILGYNYGHDETVRQFYVAVLEKNNTTQAQFDSSLVWYTDHPKIFNRIYPRVIATIDEEYKICAEINGTDLISDEIKNLKFQHIDSIICPLLKPINYNYDQINQNYIDSINHIIPYYNFGIEYEKDEIDENTNS